MSKELALQAVRRRKRHSKRVPFEYVTGDVHVARLQPGQWQRVEYGGWQ